MRKKLDKKVNNTFLWKAPLLVESWRSQSNIYYYYLVKCSTVGNPILNGGDPILVQSIACTSLLPGGVPLGANCEGIYAVLYDPTGAYNQAANLYIHMGDSTIPRTIWANVSWSSSIEWLQDPRSYIQININAPTTGVVIGRIMLLGSNHSF